jgi:hypothetical protein
MNKHPAGRKPNGRIRPSGRHIVARKRALRDDAGLSLESPVDYESEYRLASQAADLCAEQRGFHHGAEFQDWLEAEEEIDRILMR